MQEGRHLWNILWLVDVDMIIQSIVDIHVGCREGVTLEY